MTAPVGYLWPRGPRFWCLMYIAVGHLAQAWLYLFGDAHELAPALAVLTHTFTIYAYGGLWLLAGLGALWTAYRRHDQDYLFGFMALPAVLWCIAYFADWSEGGWSFGFRYLMIAGLVFWVAKMTPEGGWLDRVPVDTEARS